MSTTYPNHPASNCIDGNIATMCHSENGSGSWLQLDLGWTRSVGMVRIYNRKECCQERLGNHDIWVGDTAGTKHYHHTTPHFVLQYVTAHFAA